MRNASVHTSGGQNGDVRSIDAVCRRFGRRRGRAGGSPLADCRRIAGRAGAADVVREEESATRSRQGHGQGQQSAGRRPPAIAPVDVSGPDVGSAVTAAGRTATEPVSSPMRRAPLRSSGVGAEPSIGFRGGPSAPGSSCGPVARSRVTSAGTLSLAAVGPTAWTAAPSLGRVAVEAPCRTDKARRNPARVGSPAASLSSGGQRGSALNVAPRRSRQRQTTALTFRPGRSFLCRAGSAREDRTAMEPFGPMRGLTRASAP